MGNLLFSPSGRINPSEFIKAAIILIGLGIVLALPGLLGMTSIAAITALVSYLLIYPWVVIWIKRYHDAGKSGWMSLVPVIVYMIAAMVLTIYMLGDEFMAIFQAASEGASQAEQQALSEGIGEDKQLSLIVASTALSAAIAFLFNSIIKHDDHENQYGEQT